MTVTLFRTRDLARVRALVASDPRVYDAAADDGAPPASEFEPNAHPAIAYVVASDDAGDIGLYTFVPRNAATWEMHATLVFGSRAQRAAREAIVWAFSELGARRVIAEIPATNRAAIRAARRAGMREYGRDPRSFLKRGLLVDRVLLGISPE